MFCIVIGLEDYGIGKLVKEDGKTCFISFFISPTDAEIVIETSLKKIKQKSLHPQTRVYWKNPETDIWQVGRVIVADIQSTEIQFPQRDKKILSTKELFVRCKKIINDPTPYLANFINETPFFSVARSGFVEAYIEQRGVSNGMSGLLSSTIELEEHQINVIQRVLVDPVQRYLLADEVGLGKTIEAGILIRQHILDNPLQNVVVIIVPPSLIQQWKSELTKLFHLQGCFDCSVHIVSSYDIEELQSFIGNCTMLVVDEAHHVTENVSSDVTTTLYQVVNRINKCVDNLLLLSATPILGNETGFLSMLHLLDPTIYSLDSIDSFKKKITNREALARIIAQLQPEEVYFLDETLDELEALFPEDTILRTLSKHLRGTLEDSLDPENKEVIASISAVRAHISETYKLHRRILRNRRSKVQGLTPNRIGIEFIKYDCSDYEYIVETIDNWREKATLWVYGEKDPNKIKHLSITLMKFIGALFYDSSVLLSIVEKRLKQNIKTNPANFFKYPSENNFLEKIRNACHLVLSDQTKLNTLSTKLSTLLETGHQVIVFCTAPKTADTVYNLLESRFGDIIKRHTIDSSWSDKNSWAGYDVLICDHRSEEGLNLQGGKKCIIHYDLPLSPNRIEQRIGRLDRFGSNYDIKSFSIISRHNDYELAWGKCLNEGFCVFNTSIAGLQYVVESQMQELTNNLFFEGIECLDLFTAKLKGDKEKPGIVQRELKRIELQDSLDELTIPDEKFLYDIEDVDEEWKKIEKTVDQWVNKCLMFEKIPFHIEGNPPPDRVFRYIFNYGRRRNTLIPFDDFVDIFLPCIDPDAPGRTIKEPKTYPFSFRRQTSVSKGLQLLRYGSEFIESIFDFTQYDDRGRSFAIWRCNPNLQANTETSVFFRFGFMIETDLKIVREYCESITKQNLKLSIPNIKRQSDLLLPPFMKTIWIDSDLRSIDESFIDECLEIGYEKRPRASNGIFDTNINPKRWEIIHDLGLPFLDYWKDLCFDAKYSADNLLKASSNLNVLTQKCVKKSKELDQYYFKQQEARISHLTPEEAVIEKDRLNIDMKLKELMYDGALKPKVTIDSVGVVFLSQDKLNEFEKN
jgi:ATP-dependent helicase HepA